MDSVNIKGQAFPISDRTTQIEKISVSPEIESTDLVINFIDQYLNAIHCPAKDIWGILTSVDELFTNIARHSNDSSYVIVYCWKNIEDNAVFIRFVDGGIPFNPLLAEEPQMSKKASDRKIGGLGIYISKNLMDSIAYEYLNNMNILTISKVINK